MIMLSIFFRTIFVKDVCLLVDGGYLCKLKESNLSNNFFRQLNITSTHAEYFI